MKNRVGTACLGSLVSLLALCSPALAQGASTQDADSQAGSDERPSDIVVTATRRSETVRTVPFNIQAITSETLQNTGATDLADFARTVPGLSFTELGAERGTVIVLRGLRTGLDSAFSPTTTVYVDEVPMDLPYRGGPLDLKLVDIERVEVLRGPQGTLFGGGAIGGTIRYISKKPDLEEFEGRVGAELSGTRYGGANYNLTAMLNVPVNDWIAVRGNIGHFDNDGFIDNSRLGTKNINDDRVTSGRIAVLLKPSDDLRIDLTYNRQEARYGEESTLRESRAPLMTDVVFPGSTRYTAQLANLTVAYDFGAASLTSSTSYVHERQRSKNDYTFFIRDALLGAFLPNIPEFNVTTERYGRSYGFTQELRLVSNSDGPFSWIIGGYYNKKRVREDQQERVPVPFPGQDAFEQNVLGVELNDDKEFTYGYDNRFREYALFGELKYQLTDAWQASIGGRYFDVKGRGDSYAIDQWFGIDGRDANGIARTVPFASERQTGTYHEKRSVWRFNTSYKLGARNLIYATIAQGYRPGGFNLATPISGVVLENRQYKSDDLISYELGGKFSLLDNRVYLSSALFYIDWSDIQASLRTPTGFGYLGNAGKAVSKGVELELEARDLVAEGLRFNLGYSYTNVKLTETVERIGFDGERVPYVPRHTLSLMADYETPVSADLKLGFNWLSTYTSGTWTDFGPFQPVRDPATQQFVPSTNPNPLYLPIDEYWLTNVSMRLNGEGWSARLFVDNLFDKRFTSTRSYVAANSPFSGPDVLYNANRPRTIGIGLTKDF